MEHIRAIITAEYQAGACGDFEYMCSRGTDYCAPRLANNPEFGTNNVYWGVRMLKELMDFIKGLPSYLRDELKQMKDDQLMDLAGKIAVPYIEKTYPQKSIQDPVVLWETVKGRVFTALKTLRDPGGSGLSM